MKTKKIENALSDEDSNYINDDLINQYKVLNPDYYYTYVMLAEMYFFIDEKELAIDNLELSLTKAIGKKTEIVSIKARIKEISELIVNE